MVEQRTEKIIAKFQRRPKKNKIQLKRNGHDNYANETKPGGATVNALRELAAWCKEKGDG